MTANGEYVKRLGGQHRGNDDDPDWYNPEGWAVSPAISKITTWGRLKQRAHSIK
jgi:hypothetical protein